MKTVPLVRSGYFEQGFLDEWVDSRKVHYFFDKSYYSFLQMEGLC